MVNIGNTEAGKSSLTRTLVAGHPDLTDEADRTHVIDVRHWQITEEDTIEIFDQGGNPIYIITNQFFISPKSYVFISHNIVNCNPESLQTSLSFLQRTLLQNPQNEIHFFLTQTDRLDNDRETKEQNHNDFRQKVQEFLVGQIQCIERRLDPNVQQLISVRRLHHDKSESSLEEQVHVYTEKLHVLEEEEKKDKAIETNHMQDYTQSSVINLFKTYIKKLQAMRFFQVSSLNNEGFDDVKELLLEKVKENQVSVPTTWVECFRRVRSCGKEVISTSEFQQMYDGVEPESLSAEAVPVTEQAKICLQYMNDIGLLIWYGDCEGLSKFVFINIDFLIEMFKSVFDHKLDMCQQYNQDPFLKHQFKEDEIKQAAEKCEKEGLLDYAYLTSRWKLHRLDEDKHEVLIRLMRESDICYEVVADQEYFKDNLYFFPWFVKDRMKPQDLNINQPMIVDSKCISFRLQCVFYNSLPPTVCEMLCVRLQKHAVLNHYKGQRKAWADGLYAELGPVKCFVFRAEESLDICLRGKHDALDEMWQFFRILYNALLSIVERWHGVVKHMHSICPHCVLKGIAEPKTWLPSEVFPTSLNRKMYPVTCDKEPTAKIPEALVVCPCDDTHDRTGAMAEVVKYLSGSWQEKAATSEPLVPVYLDCHRMSPTAVLLSWAWPETTERITGAVILFREWGGEWFEGRTQDTSTSCQLQSLKTHAVYEFRVAVTTETGTGQFTPVQRLLDVSDEPLTAQDRQQLQSIYESLMRMQHVPTVLTRLISRGVIPINKIQSIRQCLKSEGPTAAVGEILDEILDAKSYQVLYKLQKTLHETQQHHLGDLIPVRTKTDEPLETADVKPLDPPQESGTSKQEPQAKRKSGNESGQPGQGERKKHKGQGKGKMKKKKVNTPTMPQEKHQPETSPEKPKRKAEWSDGDEEKKRKFSMAPGAPLGGIGRPEGGPATKKDISDLQEEVRRVARGLSDQMYKQGQQHHEDTLLNQGDASQFQFVCKHKLLRKHQQDIENRMCPSQELIDKLFTHCALTQGEKQLVQDQRTDLGKTKRILKFVDEKGEEGVSDFVRALGDCEDRNNLFLAQKFYSDFPHEEEQSG